MKDTVGEELARRWSEPWPWRAALGVAVLLHGAVITLVAITPSHHRRSLQLPSVQVRMVAPAAAPAPSRAAPPAAARPRPAPPVEPPRPAAARKAAPPRPAPAKAAVNPAKEHAPEPVPVRPQAEPPVAAPAAGDAEPAPDGTGAGPLHSSFGSVGLGPASNSAAEEPFPFSYYLNRFISAVESNWYRPPAPAETRCRVRCRIDRSGRLVEAGIEDESGVPAFDRAALRAVYASAPFPPLPQAYTGAALTLHLDFGPQ
jgi:TonB family protein